MLVIGHPVLHRSTMDHFATYLGRVIKVAGTHVSARGRKDRLGVRNQQDARAVGQPGRREVGRGGEGAGRPQGKSEAGLASLWQWGHHAEKGTIYPCSKWQRLP